MSDVAAASSTGPLRGPLRKRNSSLWARHPDDWYVEEPWVSRRLFEIERFDGEICDPAMGGGNIVTEAVACGMTVHGRDIAERNPQHPPIIGDWLAYNGRKYENIVSNPPFKLCDDRKTGTHPFVEQCLRYSRRKVALILPANWVQGDARSRWLERSPLRRVLYITPRPSMPPGDALAAGMKPGNGTTDYAWFIWLHGFDGKADIGWCRRTA